MYLIPEVAEVLRISRSTVYDLIKSGDLRTVTIGRNRRVAAEDLEAYVQTLRAGK